jgi:hypothetical protein
MLLLAGGESDPNLLQMMTTATAKQVPFGVALAGRDAVEARCDQEGFFLNGAAQSPASLFARFNCFGYDPHKDTDQWWRYHNWHTCLVAATPQARRLNARGKHTDKFQNLRLAALCGMAIPRTVVGDAAPFDGIAKPLHGGATTRAVRAGDRPPWGMSFFQEYLPGPEYRIYVVGDQVWQFAVTSPSLDYRVHQDAALEVVTFLDQEVARVLDLMSRLGLDFAAVDMRCNASQVCFLEINDGPMFVAFDNLVGRQISGAIVDWLTNPPAKAGTSD